MSIMLWSRCKHCGKSIHRWGAWRPRWVHETEKARGKPQHPAGWEDYNHKAQPIGTTSVLPLRPIG